MTPEQKATFSKLMAEAQHTTLCLMGWTGCIGDMQGGKQLSQYFMKWIDIAQSALTCALDDSVGNWDLLQKDLTDVAVIPVQGMQSALREYAKKLKIAVEPSKVSDTLEISAWKKASLTEIETMLAQIKNYKQGEKS